MYRLSSVKSSTLRQWGYRTLPMMVEVQRCSLAPHMAELHVLILTILLILTLLMQSCCCCSLSSEHRWVSAWVDFFLAFHKTLKLVLLCLGFKTKPEEIHSTFLLFFPPIFLAIGLVTTEMSTQHSWIGKALEELLPGSKQLRVIYRRVLREWKSNVLHTVEEEVNQKPQPNEQLLLWCLRWPSCSSGAPAEGVSL